MKRFLPDIIALCILLCLVMTFFFRLFYPTSQLLVTPDFGRSDAWHFSMPTKFALSESLKKGELPLWRDDAGTGFPLFAEGQTGALYLPNLILFSLFEWTTAYNLLLAFAIFTLASGMYFLLRVLKRTPIAGLFGAISIAFSGLSILQLPHIALLQGMSLFPFIIGMGMLALGTPTLFNYAVVTLLITQQIFIGFPQAVFLTVCMLYAYCVYETCKTKNYWRAIFLIVATIVGLVGASAQLLPSYEFLQASTNPHGFDQQTASMFSLPLSHLQSFIHPFIFGNPKMGTYPAFYNFDASIFWENTAYLGIFPLFFALYWFLTNKHRDRWFYLLLIFGSILLAWGKHSPLYLLYGVWPLTLFRAPSRFLWITSFAILIVSSLQVSTWWNQSKTKFIKSLLFSILVLQTIVLMSTWWSYHLFMPKDILLSKPPQLPAQSVRFTTIGESIKHNRIFTTIGWRDGEDYVSLYKGLSPLSNIFWHASQYSIYAGRFLKRQSLYNDVLTQEIQLSPDVATVSASAISLLSTSSVKEIHSFIPIHNELLQVKQTISRSIPLYIYDNATALDQAYIARTATTASTVREAVGIITNPSFTKNKTALVSSVDATSISRLNETITDIHNFTKDIKVTINRPTHTRVEIIVPPLAFPTLLVLSDTYYPDWKATVDGNEVPIFPVNLTYRGIIVPEESRQVVFSYAPKSLRLGIQISLFTHALIAIAIVFQLLLSIFHIQKKV